MASHNLVIFAWHNVLSQFGVNLLSTPTKNNKQMDAHDLSSRYRPVKYGMKLRIPSKTSTAAPLKFGN